MSGSQNTSHLVQICWVQILRILVGEWYVWDAECQINLWQIASSRNDTKSTLASLAAPLPHPLSLSSPLAAPRASSSMSLVVSPSYTITVSQVSSVSMQQWGFRTIKTSFSISFVILAKMEILFFFLISEGKRASHCSFSVSNVFRQFQGAEDIGQGETHGIKVGQDWADYKKGQTCGSRCGRKKEQLPSWL